MTIAVVLGRKAAKQTNKQTNKLKELAEELYLYRTAILRRISDTGLGTAFVRKVDIQGQQL